MNIKKYICVLLQLTISASTYAVDLNDPLSLFLKDFQSLEANFVQSLINQNGEELEKTEGVLHLQQPGKFHWSYETPYSQKIISTFDEMISLAKESYPHFWNNLFSEKFYAYLLDERNKIKKYCKFTGSFAA